MCFFQLSQDKGKSDIPASLNWVYGPHADRQAYDRSISGMIGHLFRIMGHTAAIPSLPDAPGLVTLLMPAANLLDMQSLKEMASMEQAIAASILSEMI
ncbi:hypothetical protein AtDm6_0266 [Acetobacter tropicalis]|uniref:Uncharacterized protein n=2 Tax=Acetobacter tropicalis TaxID=104102 RepID=A0A094Z045_9PROT|nr:hypothetical protein AtDm6_0266 [Acetobacter tropicalis]